MANTNTARATQTINYEVNSTLDTLDNATKRLRVLQSAELAEIVRMNPDCHLSVSSCSPTIELAMWMSEPRADAGGIDIRDYAGSADADGYTLSQTDELATIHGTTIIRRINIEQRYAPEEKALLRSIGKLQTQCSSHETLVCGI